VSSIQLMLSEDKDGDDGPLGNETPDDVEVPEEHSRPETLKPYTLIYIPYTVIPTRYKP